MSNFQSNPFMDMFKQAFESPMNMWSQAFEMAKNNDYMKAFSSNNWMGAPQKMMESFPWMKHCVFSGDEHAKKAFNFGENVKGMEAFSELSHLALENSQAMLHRQAEIIQRHANELYKAMHEISSSHDHANSMEAQQEYMRVSFDALVNDFKELAEMYSKASIETFGAASEKMKHHFDCHGSKNCSKHHHAEHKPTTGSKKK